MCVNTSLVKGVGRPVKCTQYCKQEFQGTHQSYKMKSSMSRKGDCWDTQSKISLNAVFGMTRAGIGIIRLR